MKSTDANDEAEMTSPLRFSPAHEPPLRKLLISTNTQRRNGPGAREIIYVRIAAQLSDETDDEAALFPFSIEKPSSTFQFEIHIGKFD